MVSIPEPSVVWELFEDDVSVEDVSVDVLFDVGSAEDVGEVFTTSSGTWPSSEEQAIKTNINEEQTKLINAVFLAFWKPK